MTDVCISGYLIGRETQHSHTKRCSYYTHTWSQTVGSQILLQPLYSRNLFDLCQSSANVTAYIIV